MDTDLVPVTKWLRFTDVDPSSSSVVRSSRNLQPDSSLRNWNSRNLKPEERERYCLYEENKSSVVSVSNLGVPQGHGSGFIWDISGRIITNYHVIGTLADLLGTLADLLGTYEAKVVGSDQDNDVAVLHIDAPRRKLQPIKAGTSSNLCVCQDVCAIGHPFRPCTLCSVSAVACRSSSRPSPARRSRLKSNPPIRSTTSKQNSGQGGHPSGPAKVDLCRQAAGGRPYLGRLQHPEGIHSPPCPPPPWWHADLRQNLDWQVARPSPSRWRAPTLLTT